MKLARLLEEHLKSNAAGGLKNNFGDAYLCQNNKIYANIRKACVKANFKFSTDRNEAYQALPLSQLSAILNSKVIPYIDNISVLKQIENQIPKVAVWDDISDNLKKNYIFHESCHAVARSLISDRDAGDKVLNLLLEESFANTCELLAVLDANDGIHRIFYEWNSYTALFEERTNLKNAITEIGEEVFMKIIFFGYLHSNYLNDHIDDKQLQRVLRLVAKHPFSSKQMKTIKALIKLTFTLNSRFKEVTTRFYMRLSGFNLDYDKIRKTDYLSNFENGTLYGGYVNTLILTALSSD